VPRAPQNDDGKLAHELAKPNRVAAFALAAGVLTVGALVGVAWTAGYERVWHQLLHPHWLWFPVAFAGEAVAYLGYTLAYRELTRAERGPELDVPSAAALVTTGFGVFVQGGGFAFDRAALERVGLSQRQARERVLGLGTLEYAVLAPTALVAAAFLLLLGRPIDPSLTLSWVIGVPLGSALALLALRYKDRLERSGWQGRIHVALEAIRLVLSLLRQPLRASLAFVGIGFYWLGDIFCLWAALRAFSATTPPVAQLLIGYATGYALTRRALPIGGAGIVEALLPFALGWVAIARAPAVLAVAAYRVFNLWLPLLPALTSIPKLRRLERRRVHKAAGQRI